MQSEIIGFGLILVMIFSLAVQYLMLDTERKQLKETRESKKILFENLKPKYIKDDQRNQMKPKRNQKDTRSSKVRL